MSKIKVNGEWVDLGIDTVNGMPPDEDGNVTVNAEDPTNKVTTITSASTDQQYPSAKAVVNYVNSQPGPTTVKETDIKWGDFVKDGVTPLDFAAYNEFNPNRLAFMDGSQITVEKSTDGGSTWSDYGLTAKEKQNLVTLSQRLYTGGAATGSGTGNRLRVTINAYSNLYMRTKKILVNITSNGASGLKLLIEHSTNGAPDTFVQDGIYDIGGWPGWNSVPYESVFGGSASFVNQYKKIRLTFYYTGAASSGNQLILDMIRILGTPSYNAPSTLANTGHMYTYDIDKNVTFPANVIAQNIENKGKVTVGGTEYDIRIMGSSDNPTPGVLFIKLED